MVISSNSWRILNWLSFEIHHGYGVLLRLAPSCVDVLKDTKLMEWRRERTVHSTITIQHYIDGSIWLSLLLKRGQSLFICYEAECSLWKTIEEGDSLSGSSPRKGPSIRSHVQCITTCLQIWNRYGILHWIDLWKIDDRCEKTVDGEKSVGEYGCFAVKEIAEWSARISKLLVHGYSFSPGPAPRVDCVGGVEPSFADWSWNWHWICGLQLNSTQRIDNDLKKSTAFFRQLFANFLQILPTVMRSRAGCHTPPPHTHTPVAPGLHMASNRQ